MNEDARASLKSSLFFPGGQVNGFTSQEMIGWLVQAVGWLLFRNKPAKYKSGNPHKGFLIGIGATTNIKHISKKDLVQVST